MVRLKRDQGSIRPPARGSSLSDPRGLFSARQRGPITIGLLVVAEAMLWLVARPAGEPSARYVGQLLGAEAILLLSVGLVLISVLPWVETWFDGIDRVAIWHRRVEIIGLALLVPHIALASNPAGTAIGRPLAGAVGLFVLAAWAILPRWQSVLPSPLRGLVLAARDAPVLRNIRRVFGGYERWRALHRTTGLFVATGFAHGLLDATPFAHAPVLRWSYVLIGGVGLGFYAYRELLARFFLPHHDYEIDTVHDLGDGLVEIALRPLGRPIEFVAGQFAIVYLEGKDGWHRHPFTIASAPREGIVRFTIKARGDWTSSLHEILEPGMPAVVIGPHGRFDYRKGTDRQLWIAGGVGVAPFLSWLRALDGDLPHRIDFFYAARGEPPFAEEIRAIVARHDSLHAHLIDTSVEGRLTAEDIMARAGAGAGDLSIFMCGPQDMVQTFQAGFRRAGIPARRVRHEYFNWR